MSNNTLTHYTTDKINNPILLAEHFSKSGYFQDAKDISKAVVKIIAGQELGFGPMASMAGFHIIQGKPTLSANLMAAAIKRSGKYNFKVKIINDEVCTIQFFEQGQDCGESTFTIEEAKKAGTQNLAKFPKNMLYARALSNGAKWFCPDVLNGSPIYTPEELGATIDSEGEVIDTNDKPKIALISDAQLKYLLKSLLPQLSVLQDVSVDTLQSKIRETMKVDSITELSSVQAKACIDSAEAKILALREQKSKEETQELPLPDKPLPVQV